MSEKLSNILSTFVEAAKTVGMSAEENDERLYDYIIQADSEGKSADPEVFRKELEGKGFDVELIDMYSSTYSTGMKLLKRKSRIKA